MSIVYQPQEPGQVFLDGRTLPIVRPTSVDEQTNKPGEDNQREESRRTE